jgi:hypothetical protein
MVSHLWKTLHWEFSVWGIVHQKEEEGKESKWQYDADAGK